MEKREYYHKQIKEVASTNSHSATQVAILMALFEIAADIRDILTEQKEQKQ